jgi:CIC family chloride channel protein
MMVRQRARKCVQGDALMTKGAAEAENGVKEGRDVDGRARGEAREDAAVAETGPQSGVAGFFRENIIPNLSDFLRSREMLVWLIALAVGGSAAYAAIAFRLAIGQVQLLWLGSSSERVFALASALPWHVILAAPAVGGLIVGLLLTFLMPGKRAYGVADVIEAQAIKNSRISIYEGLGSALVTIISLGFGASAGREGPVVHLGASIASWLKDMFSLDRAARRTILACGVAAAVSASFNVPLAGVLFAHEVILGHYALRAFVPVAISSALGAVIVRSHLGNFPAFIIPEYHIVSNLEFPAFALLGLICALVAIAFQLTMVGADRLSRGINMPLWLRPVAGGLLIGLMAIFFPQILGVGYDATDAALKSRFPLSLLLQLLVLKALATAITLASRFGGGVFSPSLYLGAMAGGAFGLLAAMIFPAWEQSLGLYAITGMGAVAASILGAPISTVLIAFELTGDYNVTIALLLAVSISTSLHRAILGHSFFHWQLNSRGLFLGDGPHRYILHTLKVNQFMTPLAEGEDDRFNPEGEEGAPWLATSANIEHALRVFDRTGEDRIAVIAMKDPEKLSAGPIRRRLSPITIRLSLTPMSSIIADVEFQEARRGQKSACKIFTGGEFYGRTKGRWRWTSVERPIITGFLNRLLRRKGTVGVHRERDDFIMQQPVEILFENLEASEAVRQRVGEEMEKLEKINSRLSFARVTIARPHKHHVKGNMHEVRIMLKAPGMKDVIVNHAPGNHDEHDDVYIAIRDAFNAARRQLRDKTPKH